MLYRGYVLGLFSIILSLYIDITPESALAAHEQCVHVDDTGIVDPELLAIYDMYEQTNPPTCTDCQSNKDNHIPGPAPLPNGTPGTTWDKCIISGTGSVCNPSATSFTEKKCCDWDVEDWKTNKNAQCSCNTNIAGPCPDRNDWCLCCMMRAEADNESDPACKKAVGCVIQKRATLFGTSICEANTKKFGNTPSLTSDKAICDKFNNNRLTPKLPYNQRYRTCREDLCNGGSDPICDAMLALMVGGCPNIDSYQVGPCPSGCTTVPIKDNNGNPVSCIHDFCDCHIRPTPAPTAGSTPAPTATPGQNPTLAPSNTRPGPKTVGEH